MLRLGGYNLSTDIALRPPYRSVSGTSDTITAADRNGLIAYTGGSAITVTPIDLGAGSSVMLQQQGAGQITVATGGLTLVSDKAVASYVSARRGAILTVIGTGIGTVYVTGNTV